MIDSVDHGVRICGASACDRFGGEDVALWPAPDAPFELFATLATDAAERAKLNGMAQGDDGTQGR